MVSGWLPNHQSWHILGGGGVHQMPKVSVTSRWHLQLSSERALSVQGKSQLFPLINKCSKLDYKEKVIQLASWQSGCSPHLSVASLQLGAFSDHTIPSGSAEQCAYELTGVRLCHSLISSCLPFSPSGDRKCVGFKLLRQILKNLIKSNKRK